MKSPAEDIKFLLELENLNFPVFVSEEHEIPVNRVTIFDTGGQGSGLTLNPEENYEYDAVQIRVRCEQYQPAWDMAYEIKKKLHGKSCIVVNDTYYSVIQCTSGPFFLDRDKKNRVRLVINFSIQRRK